MDCIVMMHYKKKKKAAFGPKFTDCPPKDTSETFVGLKLLFKIFFDGG